MEADHDSPQHLTNGQPASCQIDYYFPSCTSSSTICKHTSLSSSLPIPPIRLGVIRYHKRPQIALICTIKHYISGITIIIYVSSLELLWVSKTIKKPICVIYILSSFYRLARPACCRDLQPGWSHACARLTDFLPTLGRMTDKGPVDSNDAALRLFLASC